MVGVRATMNTRKIQALSLFLPLFILFTLFLVSAGSASASISIQEVSDSSVTISWEAAGGDVDRYIIYRNGRIVASQNPGEAMFTNQMFTDHLLAPETAYSYEVGASYGFPTSGPLAAPDHLVNMNYRDEISLGTAPAVTLPFASDALVINPFTDIEYLGGFRMPGPSGGSSWEYSGDGLTFYPQGDRENIDGPLTPGGSLFGIGHRGEMYHVSEISIPQPLLTKDLGVMPLAQTIQPFANIGLRTEDNMPQLNRGSLTYLPPTEGREEQLFHSWSDDYYFNCGPHDSYYPGCKENMIFSSSLNLSQPNSQGSWFVGPRDKLPHHFMLGKYMFTLPQEWAEEHTPGKYMVTGSFRGGNLGGAGPTLVAFGLPQTYQDQEELAYQFLVKYATPWIPGSGANQKPMNGNHKTDEWVGAEWLTTGNKQAVIIAGSKALGQYWYGFKDGTNYNDPYNDNLFEDNPGLYDGKQPKGNMVEAKRSMIIFYDPRDLEKVASGEWQPWDPQPYAALDIQDLMIKPWEDDPQDVNLGAIAFDPQGGFLYIMESFGDTYGSIYTRRPVVHVFKVGEGNPVDQDDDQMNNPPVAYNDGYTMFQGQILNVPLPGVLANDRDVDGDSLVVTSVIDPTFGTLRMEDDGSFTYVPNPSFTGIDYFTYTVFDGRLSDAARVTIIVTEEHQQPQAYSQQITVAEDQEQSITLTGSGEGELAFSIIVPPSFGSLEGTAPEVTYVPLANYFGTDRFTFQVTDEQGQSSTGVVEILITAEHDSSLVVPSPMSAGISENTRTIETLGIMSVRLNAQEYAPGEAITVAVKVVGSTGSAEGKVNILIPELGLKRSFSGRNIASGKAVLHLPYDILPGYYLMKIVVENNQRHQVMYREIVVIGEELPNLHRSPEAAISIKE